MSANSAHHALHLTQANFDQTLKDSTLPVLVDFWATWCPPCRMIAPDIEKLAAETDGKALVGKVDIDEAGDIAKRYRIESIPTLIIFKNGVEVDRMIGAHRKQDMQKRLLAAM